MNPFERIEPLNGRVEDDAEDGRALVRDDGLRDASRTGGRVVVLGGRLRRVERERRGRADERGECGGGGGVGIAERSE